MDATLSTAALAGLEKLVNTALRYDPGTRIALGKLADQVLAITVTAPAFAVYLTPDAQGLRLMGHWEGEVHTQLRGSLPALMQLARSEHTSFADSGVEVIGNTGLLVDLQRLLKNLDIDWEEALSELLGDVVGHQGANMIRGGVNYTRDRAGEVKRLVSEFLTEELHTLPSRNELEGFYQDVDDLRLHADRLEARIKQFLQRGKNG
jgi:ubiquinone biosynthesis protein UbiJ